jgi:hypothetical protein
LAFCGAGVYALYGDLVKAKKSLFPYKRKEPLPFAPPPPPPKSSNNNTSNTTTQKETVPLSKKDSWKLSMQEQGGEEAPRVEEKTDKSSSSQEDDKLPESLLKLATTPEDLNWLKAQKRISRQVKEEARIERERIARGGSFNDEDEEDEHVQMIKKKDS